MDLANKEKFHGGTTISILARYRLVSDYLNVLLQREEDMRVLDTATSDAELIEKVAQNEPDVVLICLLDGEGGDTRVISDLFGVAPSAKVVLLSSPNSLLDQPASLKL
jgi:DNA-binding NarL/FixJ family response regulator